MRRLAVIFTLAALITMGCFTGCYGSDTINIPVLLYHHLLYEQDNINKNNAGIISVENFQLQMKYLKDNEYETLTMEQVYDFLYNQKELPCKSVLITFDDGYYSNYLYAYPILKEYGFKASIFIITGCVSEDEREFSPDLFTMLDSKSIEASKDVFTYYSHTDTLHGSVAGVSGFTFYDKDLVTADMMKSFEQVDDVISFAYPYGMYNDAVISILKDLGVKLAFTTERGYITINSNPYKLPRQIIFPTHTISEFARIVGVE